MDDPLTVGVAEGGSHLSYQADDAVEGEGAEVLVGEAAPGHQRHHQIGPVGVTPVVIERDDVRMLEAGHGSRLRLEAAHKRRVVGVLGSDHLDRHLAPNGGLEGAIHHRDPPGGKTFPHLVATDGIAELAGRACGRGIEAKIWEVVWKTIGDQLEDADRGAEALEPVLAKAAHLDPGLG